MLLHFTHIKVYLIVGIDINNKVSRAEGIVLKISFIIPLRISLKIPSLCLLLFYAPNCFLV